MNQLEEILKTASDENSFDKEKWVQEKKQERELVNALLSEGTEEILKSPESYRVLLDVAARHPGHAATNLMLIARQCPDATELRDFASWKRMGVYVRRDAEPVYLFAPGKPYEREDGKTAQGYNVVRRYDISQTNARPRPAAVQPDAAVLLRALIADRPVEIEVTGDLPAGSGAFYAPNGENGPVIYAEKGMTAETAFRALAREFAHAELDFSHPDYSRMVYDDAARDAAYILCRRYGQEPEDVCPVLSPARGLSDEGLRHYLTQVRSAANALSGRMQEHLSRTAPQRKGEAR